jgi:predicted phage baseplate assembly protein
MPIPLPSYDDRRWTDLVAEAEALIPGLDTIWTDFNAHDPGITVIELVSWRVEGDIYGLNRVSDRHIRKFLELVGRPPRPPIAARVAARLTPPAGGLPSVPAGAEFTAAALDGSTCRFRALHGLVPALPPLAAALVQSASGVLVDHTADLIRAGRLVALGSNPAPGSALLLGFSDAPAVDTELGLHLGFLSGRSGLEERRRIVAELAAQRRACRLPEISSSCGKGSSPPTGPSPVTDSSPPPPLAHHDARIAWDYYGSAGWTTLDPATGHVRDDTRALTLDGPVEIKLPGPAQGHTFDGVSASFWMRARLVSGALDAPPVIGRVLANALALEQAAGSIGLYVIAAGAPVAGAPAKIPPVRARVSLQLIKGDDMIASLGFDQDSTAPECEVLGYVAATKTERGLLVLDLALLGQSDETPDQQFDLPGAPLQGGSVEVYTLGPTLTAAGFETWRRWELHPDFDAAGRGEHWATVNELRGKTQFGNGKRGRVPPDSARVFARYRTTIGSAGNVQAGSLLGLAPSLRNWLLFNAQITPSSQQFSRAYLDAVLGSSPATAWSDLAWSGFHTLAGKLAPPALGQADAATGGADAEDLDAAAGAAVAALSKPTRAITTEDYLALTLQTPGTILARADIAAGQCSSLPGLKAPGIVTVMIVPDSPPQPTPSPGLLETVRRYLDRRRIIGTFPAVVGPSYLIVSVIAQVRCAAGAQASRVLAEVTAALNVFLDPLSGGPAAVAAMRLAPSPVPTPAQTTLGATNAFGAVNAIGPSAATPIPGVQLLAATRPSLPQATPTPVPPPGWPFGRSVYRAEVLQVIQSVAGVDHVESLELSADGAVPTCGNLCVSPFQLVAPGTHTITVQ